MKLHELFPHFEERSGQEGMLEAVRAAYKQDHTLLVEAGTGIGKTFAYLLPAIEWAIDHQERTVLSTHTIALQQQLVDKDLPALLNQLGEPANVVLLKGMRHFVCLKKEEERLDDCHADHESCTHVHCPFYQQCPYFKQKRAAERAEIIVVNHHLLLADLALRHSTEGQCTVLPDYDRIIIDEAHHLEEVATSHFASRVNRTALFKLIGRMTKDAYLNHQIDDLALGLPLERRALIEVIDAYFRHLPLEKTRFNETMRGSMVAHIDASLIGARASSFLEKVVQMKLPEGEQKVVQLLKKQLDRQVGILQAWIEHPIEIDEVRWSEDESIVQAYLDIAPFLTDTLFRKKRTIILCSATLTTSKKFNYLKDRLGIEEAQEIIFDSPFDYAEQAILIIPNDLPEPKTTHFQKEACGWIEEGIDCSKGNTFVLFTSYQAMKECQALLQDKIEQKGYRVYVQGDRQRHELLEAFRTTEGAVLFGTDSFWEGVDVVGDKLRSVIITKLPFKLLSDPLFQARSEQLESQGKHPFMSYALPQAIVKFRQGFGRLIRHKEDRGFVLCLDCRLTNRGYGKQFLKNLPPCPIKVSSRQDLAELLRTFGAQKQKIEGCPIDTTVS